MVTPVLWVLYKALNQQICLSIELYKNNLNSVESSVRRWKIERREKNAKNNENSNRF